MRKLLFQITGFMAVVLMGIWTGHHLGGFAWQKNPGLEFNWHPLLMTIGMIYLYGNGINEPSSIPRAFLTVKKFVKWFRYGYKKKFFLTLKKIRQMTTQRNQKLSIWIYTTYVWSGIGLIVNIITYLAEGNDWQSENDVWYLPLSMSWIRREMYWWAFLERVMLIYGT